MLTGEMIHANSDNVHSFGYDFRQRILYVRFRTEKHGPGSMYSYSPVEPSEFQSLRNSPSPGGWVWDHLRIRGTTAGHQKEYHLVGITLGYVPRKAAVVDREQGLEAFAERQFFDRDSDQLLTSQLSPRIFSRGQPAMPNRGTPKRPNDGRPRRQ